MKLIRMKVIDAGTRPEYLSDFFQNTWRDLRKVKFPERIEKERYNIIRTYMVALKDELIKRIAEFDRDVLDD